MGVITKKLELSDGAALRQPAGMPSFKRDPISEITAFDQYAGDRSRGILVGAGAAVALLIIYTMMSARPSPDEAAPSAPPVELTRVAPPPEPTPTVIPAPEVELPVAPQQPARGRLRVASDPQAVVYEGSTRLGRTPLDLELDAGAHDLRLVNSKLYLDVRRRVDIRADKPRSLDLLFGTSKLLLEAPSGTKVYLDRRFVGETPLETIQFVEGLHRLELVYGDQRIAEVLDVQPSTTIRYRPHFEQ